MLTTPSLTCDNKRTIVYTNYFNCLVYCGIFLALSRNKSVASFEVCIFVVVNIIRVVVICPFLFCWLKVSEYFKVVTAVQDCTLSA